MPIGKIIEIEGTDGSGKETQANLLAQKLNDMGIDTLVVSFPYYSSVSSLFVRQYLNGDLGSRDTLSQMEITMLYAFDRSYTIRNLKIKDLLEKGTWIIFDRYTGSNMIYNTIGVEREEQIEMIRKIKDLEYRILDLPEPDEVFYLHVPRALSKKLIDNRGLEKDIHEKDDEYLTKVTNNGLYVANLLNWNIINCLKNPTEFGEISPVTMKTKEDISDSIFCMIQSKYFTQEDTRIKQVKIYDRENGETHSGILLNDGDVICGCCGARIPSDFIGNDEQHPFCIQEIYKDWVSLDEEILN